MRLPPGVKLGQYEIVSVLGVGGMGEVYRARDTKLRRDVALKVLPAAFAHDSDRMLRFEREAQVLASLLHPNIATIFGLEDSGDTHALVMEAVQGPTLADRIKAGPLPLEEAIEIGKQIADAIEYAHDHGVVHRDLKPANVKITPEGAVKVLDFGLAKAFAGELSASSGSAASPPEASPTLTLRATQAGVILGTAAYMAPEQAKGKAVDRRADIWAFGVVMFEMLTGEPLFTGDTAAEIMASTIKEEPKLEQLPSSTPPTIRRLIERCLHKDPRQRLQAIGEARIVLNGPWEEVPAAAPDALLTPSRSRSAYVAWAVAGVLVLALGGLEFAHFREKPPVQPSLRFQIPSPGPSVGEYLALSPDGRNLAFVTTKNGLDQVWIRAMDAIEAHALEGTNGASYPFWSPDGAYIGFFAQGKLKKVALGGGPAQTLCDATSGRGGTWNRDGVILFSGGPTSPILRVSSAGGDPIPVTKGATDAASGGDRFPSFLPDRVHFLYNGTDRKPEKSGLFAGSINGGAPVRVLSDLTNALWAPSTTPGSDGYLVFRREDTLMAQPFDLSSLKLTGEVFPIAEHVPMSVNLGFGAFSVSANGTLVYRSGTFFSNRNLVWQDRSGKRLGVVGKPKTVYDLALSPDDKTVALTITEGNSADIWLLDLNREVLSRFTFRPGLNIGAIWSSDTTRLAFSLEPQSRYSSEIYVKAASGKGQDELLLHAGVNGFATDWSADGKWLAYQQTAQNAANDIWLLPMEGDRKPVPYLQTQFDELDAHFSPDGKWLAYVSNESGQYQVYVQSVPPNGAKYQISAAGGNEPRWRRDGKELYYVALDQKLMAVPIGLTATVEPGTPQPLFAVTPTGPVGSHCYAPSRDGQRFLLTVPAEAEAAPASPITVVTNWQAALKK